MQRSKKEILFAFIFLLILKKHFQRWRMDSLGFQELMLVVLLILFMIPVIFFLLTLQNTLYAAEPQNRTMQPGKVWLLLIPFFNVFWMFMVVGAIADSAKAQLAQYGMLTNERPIYNLGLALAICSILNWVPRLGNIAGVAAMVLFVVYWVKVNQLRKHLLSLKQVYESREEGSVL